MSHVAAGLIMYRKILAGKSAPYLTVTHKLGNSVSWGNASKLEAEKITSTWVKDLFLFMGQVDTCSA
jgi:hypothetical protein